MGKQHNVTSLAEPNLNLDIRQQGNFIIIGENGLPRSSGSVNQAPFLEVSRTDNKTLVQGARTAFIEKLNGFGIDFKEIDASRSQSASGSLGAKLPKLGKGEIAFEITSEVSGGVSFRSGKIGDAVSAAEYNYDQKRKEGYQDRAYEWATNGVGATSKNPATGDTYRITPEVAKDYHNKRFPIWGDPRRADSGEESPNANIASAKTEVTAKDFGERGNHFNQALAAANGNTDLAAAVVRSSAAAGHNPKDEINVAVSNKDGALIATQGTGPGANRADPVLASQVQQGTAQNIAEALTQKNPAQQVAAIEPQPERQQQAPRTV